MAKQKPNAPQTALKDGGEEALPSEAAILAFLKDNPETTSRREIARAFGIKGDQRRPFRERLKAMTEAGKIAKTKSKNYEAPDALPPVTVLTITALDADGDLVCEPLNWKGTAPPPPILLNDVRHGRALGLGDRILARLTTVDDRVEASVIRRLEAREKPRILGVFQPGPGGGTVLSVDKKARSDYRVDKGDTTGAKAGELVVCQLKSGRYAGPRPVKIVERLGRTDEPKSISLIAIHEHGLPFDFPDAVIAEAKAAKPVTLKKRSDLRDIPLITIDPPDARDHDDAVWAEADPDPKNPGGVIVIVAIADVAHYVRPGSLLDREARKRGNSCYFPDRVVPMLPEDLSTDLCSLRPNVDRACLAVRMVFAANGKKRSHEFIRGLMKSAAKLSYAQVEAARLGTFDDETKPLWKPVLKPLWDAFEVVNRGREAREPLHLDLPEPRIRLRSDGTVKEIVTEPYLLSQRLIEELMIQANVAAAETLERRKVPTLFRVHDEPAKEKLEALQETLKTTSLSLAKGQVIKPAVFNRLIERAAGTAYEPLIGEMVLRSQSQAAYAPDNIGHFGLNLGRYAHFTSPIRRYADLIVHRGLIAAHTFGADGLNDEDASRLGQIAEDISGTERRALAAERDSTDRYMAAYMEPLIGQEFRVRIVGVTRFGLFVRVERTGADGLVPMRALPDEFFKHDAKGHRLVGERSGLVFRLGDTLDVRLEEAAPLSGGLRFSLLGEYKTKGSAKRRSKKRSAKAGAQKSDADPSKKKSDRHGRATRSKKSAKAKRTKRER